MRYKRSQRGSRSPTRRMTGWGFGPSAVDLFLTASAKVLWSTGVVLSVEEKATLVRLRGLVTFTLESFGSLGDGFFGAVGFALVTDQAFAIGTTAVPGPLAEVDWDGWLFHSFFDVRSVTATEADGFNAVGCVFRMPIDSKAMRIWEDGMTLVGVIEAQESGTATAEVQGETRTLVKLS